MSTSWKQIILVATFSGATGAYAADHGSAKEQSNHSTNKKAIAMEAKEGKLMAPAVRDWNAIDTNQDHSISPEEMEKFLTGVWSAKSIG